MIDDLITLGADEPYRMFTSRAERRLLLRQDNVFMRLMPYGKQLGMINDELYHRFEAERTLIQTVVESVKTLGIANPVLKFYTALILMKPNNNKQTNFCSQYWQQNNSTQRH